MRKLFVLLVILVFALGAAGAFAQTVEIPEETLSAGISAQIPTELKDAFTGLRGDAAFPKTEDAIKIDDGIFIITTNGITAEVMLPFGLLGFTQDLKLQLADYAQNFNDPRGLVQFLIDSGINLLVVDPESGAMVFMFIYRDTYSEILVDLQDQEMFETAQTLYQDDEVLGYKRGSATIGDRNYIRSLEPDGEENLLIYFTYYDGAAVGFQILLGGAEATAQEEELILSVIEGLAFQ